MCPLSEIVAERCQMVWEIALRPQSVKAPDSPEGLTRL
jgi:hypothetical protein